MKKIVFSMIFLFLFLPFSAISEEISNESFADLILKELDVNKDGIIDENDIKKFSKKEFDLMDKNKDNRITKDEFFEFVCNKSCNQGNCECKKYKNKEELQYLKEYWNRIDRNSDGYITREEKFNADLNSFYGLDSDGDGNVKKEDIEAQLY